MGRLKLLQDAVTQKTESLKTVNLLTVPIKKKYDTRTAVPGAAAVKIKT